MAMGDLARQDEYGGSDYAPTPEELDRLINPPMPRAPVMGDVMRAEPDRLQPPPVSPAAVPSWLSRPADRAVKHAIDYLATPGRVVQGLENRYPPGSEEADYVDRANQAAANQYAIGTGFGMVFDPGLYLARGSIGSGAGGRVMQPSEIKVPTPANTNTPEISANVLAERIQSYLEKNPEARRGLAEPFLRPLDQKRLEAAQARSNQAMLEDFYRLGPNPTREEFEAWALRPHEGIPQSEMRAPTQITVPVGGRLSDLAKRDRYEQ